MIELGMRRFADKTRSPILPENLLNLSGSGRATLLAETMADAVIIFWSTSWSDDLVKFVGSHWMRATQDRFLWRKFGEAYVQQWYFG